MKRAILLLGLGFIGGLVGTFAAPALSGLTPTAEADTVSIPAVTRSVATQVSFLPPLRSDTATQLSLFANVAKAPAHSPCPGDMVAIEGKYCIDRYEAGLVERRAGGAERAWPHNWPVDKHDVRAVSKRGIFPQSYISGSEAQIACKASGKRLCKSAEWTQACRGPEKQQFSYGAKREPGRCNDSGKSPIARAPMLGGSSWSAENMNQPLLMALPSTVAPSGSHEDCASGYGVHDMVGNVHEWIDDPNGTFLGGYFQDVEQNGGGCSYRTDAHDFGYHDYSTGFRCCADAQ